MADAAWQDLDPTVRALLESKGYLGSFGLMEILDSWFESIELANDLVLEAEREAVAEVAVSVETGSASMLMAEGLPGTLIVMLCNTTPGRRRFTRDERANRFFGSFSRPSRGCPERRGPWGCRRP